MPEHDRRMLWVSTDRTVLVDTFNDGDTLNVATRPRDDFTWGPPKECIPEVYVRSVNSPGENNKERRIIDLDTELVAHIESIAQAQSMSFGQAVEELLLR